MSASDWEKPKSPDTEPAATKHLRLRLGAIINPAIMADVWPIIEAWAQEQQGEITRLHEGINRIDARLGEMLKKIDARHLKE